MTKPEEQKLDCFRLLAEMSAHGVNNTEAARRMGKPVSTIRRWKEGSEPGYTDGLRLVNLHAQIIAAAHA